MPDSAANLILVSCIDKRGYCIVFKDLKFDIMYNQLNKLLVDGLLFTQGIYKLDVQ